ncbi:pentatricopeptide repeat-containing protein At4g21065-like [Tripterygium wilfordii]|uniref:pentatricopeptide repeat-containing protein At4g21065-like n=1 Tax=Tripterygium wilfordii TaxID=458696 RepID=UPI0018F7F3FA|nr:pentatricopeptide repeat-containing protein At4g21065-like [Tripterygium wilfordii]
MGMLQSVETAALKVIELTPADSSCYILLSNIYAKSGRWDDVENVRLMMKKRGMKKVPGCSSIFVNGKVHEFIMGKTMDVNYGGGVLSKTKEMVSLLKKEGYEPDLTQVLRDVGEDEKKDCLAFHSEKMALAFGLIKKANSAPIQIVKNLRICCDCHSFMKLASRIYNRRLIVRDQNRFHHFKDGICSCNDYWTQQMQRTNALNTPSLCCPENSWAVSLLSKKRYCSGFGHHLVSPIVVQVF